MAKHTVETRIDELQALDLRAAGSADVVAAALRERNNLVVAKAAKLAAKGGFGALAELMGHRFSELLAAGTPADKGCHAKFAIADALYQLGGESADVFRTGIRHVQLEPVFGGVADTAAELRGTCAVGLVRCGARDALALCADLLGDPEQDASIMAARALAYSGREEAALPLRTKLRCGDKAPAVMGECFLALLRLTADVGYVARFLDSTTEEIVVEAAMAIAGSRCAGAYDALRAWWDANPGSPRRELLLSPLALTRESEAIDLLIELVKNAPEGLAGSAAEALAMYRSDPQIHERVTRASEGRPRVQRAFLGHS